MLNLATNKFFLNQSKKFSIISTEHSTETDGGQNAPTEPPIDAGGAERVRAEDQRVGGGSGGGETEDGGGGEEGEDQVGGDC